MSRPSISTAQARALGAPTRQAIVGFLAAADEPVTIAELTDHLGLNHNAVRKHLTQLTDAGLVIEEREARSTPGRPRLLYRLDPSAPAAAGGAYERLAVLLAEALRSGDDPSAVGRRAARAATVPIAAQPLDALTARFEADGFEPTVRGRGRRREVVLGHCPFAAAAEANPEAVCRLHLGLAEGTADGIGGLRVDGLVPKDPWRAGCRLAVTEIT